MVARSLVDLGRSSQEIASQGCCRSIQGYCHSKAAGCCRSMVEVRYTQDRCRRVLVQCNRGHCRLAAEQRNLGRCKPEVEEQCSQDR